MQPLFSMVNLGGVHSEPPRRSHFNKILKTEKNKGERGAGSSKLCLQEPREQSFFMDCLCCF